MGVNIGVDVSKKQLDVYVLETKERKAFPNDEAGTLALVAWAKACRPERVVLEATGGYERLSVAGLAAGGLPVVRVNPRQVRDFAKAMGRLAKTDALDAEVLALFASRIQPPIRAQPSQESLKLADLLDRRRQLVEMTVSERNRLKQASAEAVKKNIEAHLLWLKQQIKDLDQDLDSAIEASDELRPRADLLTSIPGVGRITASTLLALLPEIGKIDKKQIAALVGVAPLNRDSGQSQGQRSIWGGRVAVRNILYMAAVAAYRRNPYFRDFAARLHAKGKATKVILVAIMRKMLVAANAIIRTEKPWSPRSELAAST